jgi:hypothetical protein
MSIQPSSLNNNRVTGAPSVDPVGAPINPMPVKSAPVKSAPEMVPVKSAPVKSAPEMPPVKSAPEMPTAKSAMPTESDNKPLPDFVNMLNQIANNKQLEQEMNDRESKLKSNYRKRQEKQRKIILIVILVLLILYLGYTFYKKQDTQISLGSDVHTLVTAQSFSPIEKLTIIARHCN